MNSAKYQQKHIFISVDKLILMYQIKRADYLIFRCMDDYINTSENQSTWAYSIDDMVQCDQINHPLKGVLQDCFIVRVTQSFLGKFEWPASPQRKRNGEKEGGRKEERSNLQAQGQRRATRRYMRRRGTNMTLQSGDKEWLDGGKKRHAHALVWCTSVTQNRLRLLLCRRGGGSVEVPRLVGSSEKA